MSERFDWNYPGLDWSQFHSLANLLSLRNGGQAEPSSLSDTVFEEDWSLEDNEEVDTSSLDTRLAHQISGSEHGRLKRRFFDCMAEFVANKKGGRSVACSAMKEVEDSVVIWIARNQGFSDADKIVFDKLGKMLGVLSRKDPDQNEGLLWDEMVLYHQHRIEHDYIPELRASFKAYDAEKRKYDTNTLETDSVSVSTLSVLMELLFNDNVNGITTLEKDKKLVIASYNLCRTRDVEKLLYSSPSATRKSKKLWENACLLARLRVAFQKFKDIALTLPSFEQVTFILVPCPHAHANPPQQLLSLKQTFGILRLDLTPDTAKAILGLNWPVARCQREFAERQRQKLNVHAEVQMLIFLNTTESSASGVLPYFGCSKLSCFMCNHFIQSYGRFTTRGCHGHLFKPWTVPSADRLLPGRADQTANALIKVQKEVKKTLEALAKDQIRHERTSVVGGRSISGDRHGEPSSRKSQIDRLRMKVERDRVAEMFRRRAEETISSARQVRPRPEEGDELDECAICTEPTKRKCSICNKGFFCSDSCQEKRSGRHLFTCSKRPLTSADYLWRSLAEDLIPKEESVLEDYGFNNVVSVGDMSCLFGLYQGLYLSGEFSAEDIHEWRTGGILMKKIKEFNYNIPENCRGSYFPWFLKNTHVLERPMTRDEAQQKMIATFYDKAMPYLDIEDRNTIARDLKPKAKGACYNLLAGTLIQMIPNPIETNWYSFGFVTCRGEQEENELLALYQLLITESDGSYFYEFYNRRRGTAQPVTFTQFWQAYEAGKLIQLMDSKGLKNLRSWLPFLEQFLSVPPVGPHPSVWDLKQFLEIDQPMDFPPVPSVKVDYGFINCSSFEETCILMQIYKEVLKIANPLELHRACVAGDLFRFASDHYRMEEGWRSLMENPYPLDLAVE